MFIIYTLQYFIVDVMQKQRSESLVGLYLYISATHDV